MDRWEYKIVNLRPHWNAEQKEKDEKTLESLGKNGWELTSVIPHSSGGDGIFKRKIENSPTQARSENRQTYQPQNSHDDDWGLSF